MSAMSKQVNAFSMKYAALYWFSAATGKSLNVSLMHFASATFAFNIGKLAILTIFWECVLTEYPENSFVTLTHYLSDVTLTKESFNVLVKAYWSKESFNL